MRVWAGEEIAAVALVGMVVARGNKELHRLAHDSAAVMAEDLFGLQIHPFYDAFGIDDDHGIGCTVQQLVQQHVVGAPCRRWYIIGQHQYMVRLRGYECEAACPVPTRAPVQWALLSQSFLGLFSQFTTAIMLPDFLLEVRLRILWLQKEFMEHGMGMHGLPICRCRTSQ